MGYGGGRGYGGGGYGYGRGGGKPPVDPENIGYDTSQYDRARVRGFRLLNHIMDECERTDEKTGKFKNNILIVPGDCKDTLKAYDEYIAFCREGGSLGGDDKKSERVAMINKHIAFERAM